MCRMHSLVSLINLYASTTFLVALSFDRYLCLVYPVRSRYYRTMKNAIISVSICWAIVLTICLVQIQFRQLMMRVKVPVLVNGSTPYRSEYQAAAENDCATMWTTKKERRKNLCFCMWQFPSDQAYFWFRLIAGNGPMMVVLLSYSKIKRTLRPQTSVMRELMRSSINQNTVILNPAIAATPNFRRSFHPKANRSVYFFRFCLSIEQAEEVKPSQSRHHFFNTVGALTIKAAKSPDRRAM